MKIFVKVKTGAKREYVRKVGEENYVVAVGEPPENGKANKEVVKVLAKYFDKQKSQLIIVAGEKSRNKIIELLTNRS